jgi:hypothetical protein
MNHNDFGCLSRFCLGIFSILVMISILTAPGWAQAAEGKSGWEYQGVKISDRDRNLKHYVWETARPPYGELVRSPLRM